MDEPEKKNGLLLLLGAMAALLLVVLVPVFVLALAAQQEEEQKRKEAAEFSGCVPGAEGDMQPMPEEYLPYVEEAAETAGFPPEVIIAELWTESRFQPDATNPSGAMGIAQFMPITWEAHGQGGDPFNPADAIPAMGRLHRDYQDNYLAELITNDQDRIKLSLAAYNAGQTDVLAAGGIPTPEVQAYVDGILNMAQVDFSAGCEAPGGGPIPDLGSGTWTNPLPGSVVTSPFGRRGCIDGLECDASIKDHTGLDLATPGGDGTIVAPADMEVTVTDTTESEGYGVRGTSLDNPDVEFAFIHCEVGSHQVSVGDTIAPGTPICAEGATGRADGEHLHFVIFHNGREVDPEPILIEKGIALTYQ